MGRLLILFGAPHYCMVKPRGPERGVACGEAQAGAPHNDTLNGFGFPGPEGVVADEGPRDEVPPLHPQIRTWSETSVSGRVLACVEARA